ncbi:MAG: hypothetical protein R3E88_03595 [Myxococcota bacterium]
MPDSTLARALGRGPNLGLLALLVVLVAGGGFALAVPGRDATARIEERLATAAARVDAWARERVASRPASSAERAAWASEWAALARRIPAITDDPSLVARVAADLDAPSVRQLEVAQRTPAARVADGEDDDAGAPALRVEEPFGGGALEIVEAPLRVSFRAGYDDAVRILERLESGELPARVEAIALKRDRPGVHVRVDLTYFTRRPGRTARAPAREAS